MDGHALLLLVYFLPLTLQDHGEDLQDHGDDYSDDLSVRTKRGVAKGDPHERRQIKAGTNLTFSACRYNNVPWSDCDPKTWMRTKTVQLIAEEDFGWDEE